MHFQRHKLKKNNQVSSHDTGRFIKQLMQHFPVWARQEQKNTIPWAPQGMVFLGSPMGIFGEPSPHNHWIVCCGKLYVNMPDQTSEVYYYFC